jgi:uncharacterized membrane protein YhhN
MPAALLGLVVLLGVGHIVARAQGLTRVAGVLKPLPIALLAAVALGAGGNEDASYRRLVGAALVASMAGDVFLLSATRFVAGLLCFLVAHLLYIAAFAPAAFIGAWAAWLLVPFVGFALLVLRRLWPHLGRRRAPVSVYVAVITTMGWLATLRALGGDVAPESGLPAMAGAFAFLASDATLALDRFAQPFRGAQILVMSTYYTAQVLLTLSAVARSRGRRPLPSAPPSAD